MEDETKELPLYELIVDPQKSAEGVYAVSLVDAPAIEVNWITMTKNPKQVSYKFVTTDTDKQELVGPLMIPNLPIFRTADNGGKNVYFSEETVRLCSQLFFQGAYQSRTTHQHILPLRGNTVIESWIIEDPIQDKAAKYGYSLPKGTWMVKVKVTDKLYWDDWVKTGKVKGFSLEGFFAESLINLSKINNKMIKSKMASKVNKFAVLSPEFTIGDLTVEISDENQLVVSDTGAAMPEGEYVTNEGYTICVNDDSKITEVEFPDFDPAADVASDIADIVGDTSGMYAKAKAASNKNKLAKTKAKSKLTKGKMKTKSKFSWKSFLSNMGVQFADDTAAPMDTATVDPDTGDITTEITFPAEGGDIQIVANGMTYDVTITPGDAIDDTVAPVTDPAATGAPVESPSQSVSQLKAEIAKEKAKIEKMNKAKATPVESAAEIQKLKMELAQLKSAVKPAESKAKVENWNNSKGADLSTKELFELSKTMTTKVPKGSFKFKSN